MHENQICSKETNNDDKESVYFQTQVRIRLQVIGHFTNTISM